jgi:hypothetical protein
VPDFGARLEALAARVHAWVVDTEANRRFAELVWSRASTRPSLERGVTVFEADLRAPPEEIAVEQLDAIELHHAAWSHDPRSRLEVYGAQPAADLRTALARLGFLTIESNAEGFIASRTPREGG